MGDMDNLFVNETIDFFKHAVSCFDKGINATIVVDEIVAEYFKLAIKSLESEPPKGEWIVREDEPMLYKCSFCGEVNCCKGNFCPDCGAKMTESEDK